MSILLDKYLSAVKRIIPEKIQELSVGLDIGSHSCKLIEIAPAKDSFTVVNWAVEQVKGDGVEEALKRILNKTGIHSKSPFTSLSGHGTLVRLVDMPVMSLADLKKSFHIETDKYFPFPKDQAYTDCHVVNPKNKDNKMSVLIAAAKKELVDHRLELLTKLNLQAEHIGLDSLALANIFSLMAQKKNTPASDKNAAEAPKSQAVAVLNIGDIATGLTIFKDNLPWFTRDIFLAGRDLNKRISNVLGVPFSEAEKIKCQPQDKAEVVTSTYESLFSNLVSEIRLSFDYFVTENNTPITKLFLTGGSSLLTGLDAFFVKNLDIAVEKWNPFSLLDLSPGVAGAEFNSNNHRLAVALGLALLAYD
ncbi:MAG TPA: type IV pilus assembly protein PilM [Candidatus Omnitrophota bacterium]|nr:type IV pilus assembly protein PilM [Candidatus Omnitrophota bacterium]HPD83995.1 type IV pilus assembly protein PilM [Candidatus Omnitrophota bacterium]HRZ02852.1 type IV pilus assembly protein PilM [Candidatus Omnitrophota bacterium]